MLSRTVILKQIPCRIVWVRALNRLCHVFQDHLVFRCTLQWHINKTCYCKLLSGIRFMDMPLNVNRSMMLTRLRAGRSCLVCPSVVAYQTVMLILWEFIVLCAGMYWTHYPRDMQVLPVSTHCPAVTRNLFLHVMLSPLCELRFLGAGECRHLLSFASTSSLPQGNRQDSPPPPPYVSWPR